MAKSDWTHTYDLKPYRKFYIEIQGESDGRYTEITTTNWLNKSESVYSRHEWKHPPREGERKKNKREREHLPTISEITKYKRDLAGCTAQPIIRGGGVSHER